MNLTPLVIRDWAGAIRCHRSHWSRKTKKKNIALFTWVALAKPEGVIHINDVEMRAMKKNLDININYYFKTAYVNFDENRNRH